MKIRKAEKEDLPCIVEMLADDRIGSTRESHSTHLAEGYLSAFERINSDPNQHLMVVENSGHKIVGTLQLTIIQYLTYKGGLRAQIEAVRVHKSHRNMGIGKMLIGWVVEMATFRKAHVLQLTTDKTRNQAISFYESLGFLPSHVGLKMHLE